MILNTLKETLKAKGYTYARLAREMGLSEVTVKRNLSGGSNCTLERMIEICEHLGVSFLELAALAREEEDIDYVLTLQQEAYFASKPKNFAIFKDVQGGVSSIDIQKKWKLKDLELFKLLRNFEKLNLIEILPGNQIRRLARGNVRWSHRGPLAKKILRPQIVAFLDHIDGVLENDDVCMHSAELELSLAHVPEFVEEIHALGAKYRARAYRDKSLLPSKKLKSVRWLFCFAPFRTDWDRY